MENEIKFERVNCNFCGSFEYDLILERGDLNTFLPGLFTLVRCRKCGLVYQNPRPAPESYDVIYPKGYDQFTTSLKTEKGLHRVIRGYGLNKRVKLVSQYKKKGALCDIGCAGGDFLDMASTYGYEVTGIEPNLEASSYARSLGLNIITGSLNDLNFPENSFDVITMWNVIEHLTDPKAALNQIFHLLKPDGVLVFTTPNLVSFDARLFGPYWIGYELPRHFFIFSIEMLRKFLDETGFKLLKTRFFYGSHAAFMSSLRFWLRAKFGVLPTRLENLFFSFPIRIIMSPFFYILDSLKLSSPMTVICKKDQEI